MKRKVPQKLKARAKALARPLYTRPAAVQKLKLSSALHAEHVAQQRSLHNRNEYERLSGLLHSVNPALQGSLLKERSKLF